MSPSGRTLSPEIVAARARELDTAERERRQVRQFTLEHPGMTVEDAYAIQRAWVALKIASGRKLRGRKIGLTSRAMQQSSQIDEPDYGDLLDDMFFRDGERIPVKRFIVPRLEIELAFTLKRSLAGPGCTLEQVLAATDSIVPAMEIIDARIESFDSATRRPRRVEDTISDNAANAGIVLGERPIAPGADLRWVAALCYRNEVIEESGVAAAVLNHPANGIAWLANKLAAHEVQLEAGLVVLAGSFIRPIAVQPGDVFRADYGPHGSLTCTFV